MSTTILSTELRGTNELDQLAQALRAHASDGKLPREMVSDLMVITDELLSNMLKYGNGDLLRMSVTRETDRWHIEFIDNGNAFDPLDAERPDLDTPMEKRDIGGLGLELVIAMTDSQEYQRIENHNHLLLTRRL